ncbi:MAG: AAA family ATPase [Vicinamibacterales bacterium]
MYEQFFGFRERPFDLTPNPRLLVLTEGHREALSNLQYAIASRKGITLLLGEAGSGKTTLIRAAIERQASNVHCVHMHNPALSRPEFVEMLAHKFSLSEEARTSKTALLLEIEALLRTRDEAGDTTVLIVDEAQSLPDELLEEIRLLANIETDERKLLSVIIAGQPELGERLNNPELRQLKQRVALRCELRPLTLTETVGYLAGRIQAAGGVGRQVFTREAVLLIHERSRGIPRIISVIADNALLSGFATEQRPVSSQLVLDVCHDFDIPGLVEPVPVAEPVVAAAEPAKDGRLLSVSPRADEAPRSNTSGEERADPLEPESAGMSGVLARWRRFLLSDRWPGRSVTPPVSKP